MTSSGAPSAASATASGSPEAIAGDPLGEFERAFQRLGEGAREALGFGRRARIARAARSLPAHSRRRTGGLGPPSAARCAAAMISARRLESASRNSAACSRPAGPRSSSASASRRSSAPSIRCLARRASAAKSRGSIGGAAIAGEREENFDFVVIGEDANEFGVEIVAPRHGAGARIVAGGGGEEPLARQGGRALQNMERGFAAERFEARENVGGLGAGREFARDRAARRVVGVPEALGQRGGEFGAVRERLERARQEIIGRDAQPEQPVGGARAARQRREERQIGRREIRSQETRSTLQGRNSVRLRRSR